MNKEVRKILEDSKKRIAAEQEKPKSLDKLITPMQLAGLEGVAKTQVFRWINGGQVYPPPIRKGSRLFIQVPYIVFDPHRGRPVGAKDSQPRVRRWRRKPVQSHDSPASERS